MITATEARRLRKGADSLEDLDFRIKVIAEDDTQTVLDAKRLSPENEKILRDRGFVVTRDEQFVTITWGTLDKPAVAK